MTRQHQQRRPLKGLWSVVSVSSALQTAACGRWLPRPLVLSEPRGTTRGRVGGLQSHTVPLLHAESFTPLGVTGKNVQLDSWLNKVIRSFNYRITVRLDTEAHLKSPKDMSPIFGLRCKFAPFESGI